MNGVKGVLVVLAALALLGSACGGARTESQPAPADRTGETNEGWSRYEPMESSDAACPAGTGTPITRSQALKTLQTHGFSMRSEALPCFLTNDRAGERLADEGIVSCLVRATPPPDAPKTVSRRGADGADAELVLENVECVIFTDSPTGETKIDRLETAFAELERMIRP